MTFNKKYREGWNVHKEIAKKCPEKAVIESRQIPHMVVSATREDTLWIFKDCGSI